MARWVFCNRCFQPPQATSSFSLTNCGHVYCDVCLRKGKRDECLICKVACRTILLSKHTDSDIQALFMGIDSLCRKYAKETSQISEFQEKHRRRLLAFYGEKISQLEESLRKSTLRVEQLQRVRSQQAVFSTVETPASTPSARPNRPLFQSRVSSASERVESMEVDLTPSPRRKPEVTAGPPRISLLSPPRDGRMVHHFLWTVSPQSCGCVWSWGFQEVGAALKVGPDPVGSMSLGYAHPGKGHVRTQPEGMSAGGTLDPPDHQDSDLPVPCSGTPTSGLWETEMDVAEAEPAGVARSQADRGTLSRGSHAWGAVASVAA